MTKRMCPKCGRSDCENAVDVGGAEVGIGVGAPRMAPQPVLQSRAELVNKATTWDNYPLMGAVIPYVVPVGNVCRAYAHTQKVGDGRTAAQLFGMATVHPYVYADSAAKLNTLADRVKNLWATPADAVHQAEKDLQSGMTPPGGIDHLTGDDFWWQVMPLLSGNRFTAWLQGKIGTQF